MANNLLVVELLVLSLVTIATLSAYRNGKALSAAWERRKADYDRMIERLTRSPYDGLRNVSMPVHWVTTTAFYAGNAGMSTSTPGYFYGPRRSINGE